MKLSSHQVMEAIGLPSPGMEAKAIAMHTASMGKIRIAMAYTPNQWC